MPSRVMVRKARRKKKNTVSGLELRVHEWLKEAGISFKTQYPISRIHVDLFLEPNLVVEVQGCYFHACAKCKPKTTAHNRGIKAKDRKRFLFLTQLGYQILPLWECSLKEEHKEATIQKIREALAP